MGTPGSGWSDAGWVLAGPMLAGCWLVQPGREVGHSQPGRGCSGRAARPGALFEWEHAVNDPSERQAERGTDDHVGRVVHADVDAARRHEGGERVPEGTGRS